MKFCKASFIVSRYLAVIGDKITDAPKGEQQNGTLKRRASSALTPFHVA
jgi:hypothetical protein